MKKLVNISSTIIMIIGFMLVIGGIYSICFTYRSIAQENIITPEDSHIPTTPVRGPFTLKAQADIIREHTLKITGGKTFAEMPRQIQKIDAQGVPIVGVDGKPVMIDNSTRDIWITATTLTTALNVGILAYAFSAIISLLGITFILIGIALHRYK